MSHFSHFDIETCNSSEIKQLFQEVHTKHNPNTTVNFLTSNYTLNDIEECETQVKYMLNERTGSNVKKNSIFIGRAKSLLISELMQSSTSMNSTASVITPATGSRSDAAAMNSIDVYNLVSIDTQVLNLVNGNAVSDPESNNNIQINLSEKISNVYEINMNLLQVPYSFYNINSKKGNNTIKIRDIVSNTVYDFVLEDGCYEIGDIIDELNAISATLVSSDLLFKYNTRTNKVQIKNNNASVSYEAVFFDSTESHIPQITLGWMLGFKDLVFDSAEDKYVVMQKLIMLSVITANYCQQVYKTKNLLLYVDDFNQNQHNKNIIQIDNTKLNIKPDILPMDAVPNGNCMTCDNMDDIVVSKKSSETNNNATNLTKKEKYSQVQNLKYKEMQSNKYIQSLHVDKSNLFSIINLDYSDVSVGSTITAPSLENESNNYRRVYYKPVNIDRLNISIHDDQGFPINFNGCDWSMSLVFTSKH